jgi:peptidoglycan-N-acetylglucosamine deacetylase
MLNSRVFNIISIVLIFLWILIDRYFRFTNNYVYGWLLLVYVTVIFCGSYFIRLGFFIKSINRANTKEKWIALSFDDGPSPMHTVRLLDILKTYRTEAAFFCIGKKIGGNEPLLKRIHEEGHIICNHSFTHDRFFDLFSAEKMLKDIRQMSVACEQVLGRYPVLFRPPYGVTNPNLKKAVLKGGFTSVGWTIRSFDTMIRNEDKLLKRITGRLKPGAILLLHDTSETTLQILPRLLELIRNKGYQTVRLDKMLNLTPYA